MNPQQQPQQPQPTAQQPAGTPVVPNTQTPVALAQNPTAENAQRDNPQSTQATLLISELRDGVVIMKDGSFRAVIACKSINFDLMSENEREGVEYSFQSFLNSLGFTTQILVRSQRVDITPYIERLSEIRRNTDNMLLGVLMDDYINFISVLSEEANIMDKAFFIVLPYYSSPELEKAQEQSTNFFKTFSKDKGPAITRIDRDTYDKALTELNQRVDSVISGLFQIGIHSVRLNTKELSELYYNFNNPDTAVREPFIDFSKVATTVVRRAEPLKKPAPEYMPKPPTLTPEQTEAREQSLQLPSQPQVAQPQVTQPQTTQPQAPQPPQPAPGIPQPPRLQQVQQPTGGNN